MLIGYITVAPIYIYIYIHTSTLVRSLFYYVALTCNGPEKEKDKCNEVHFSNYLWVCTTLINASLVIIRHSVKKI